MNFKAELTALKGRLFSPELYQAMGEASTQRRRERGSPGRTPSGAAPRPSWTPS